MGTMVDRAKAHRGMQSMLFISPGVNKSLSQVLVLFHGVELLSAATASFVPCFSAPPIDGAHGAVILIITAQVLACDGRDGPLTAEKPGGR